MTAAEVDAALVVSMTTHDHDAFCAAARVGWPRALTALKEVMLLVQRLLNGDHVKVELVGAGAELDILRKKVGLLLGYMEACDAIGYVERATNPSNAQNLRELVAAIEVRR